MDILCVKCGEPWNSYGVNHGDMIAWEADMLRKGIGCPSCKGTKKHDLTIMEHLENETATEGAGVEESEGEYGPSEDYVQLCKCFECSNTIKIDVNDIFYDGNIKIIYHNSGSVRFDNRDEIQRYAEAEHDWETIDAESYCDKCKDDFAKCECCYQVFPKDDTVFVGGDGLYCMDCYSETYCSCEECGEDVYSDSIQVFKDSCYCQECFDEVSKVCEVCDKRFDADDVIEGTNGETCCSEKCADDTTESV